MKCRLVELVTKEYDPPLPRPGGGYLVAEQVCKDTGSRPVPGDMWYEPDLGEKGDDSHWGHFVLSDKYWNLPEPRRAPVCVVLPDGTHFYLDSKQFKDGNPTEPGWDLSGTPPDVTVMPSINCQPRWHGWLTAGELKPA